MTKSNQPAAPMPPSDPLPKSNPPLTRTNNTFTYNDLISSYSVLGSNACIGAAAMTQRVMNEEGFTLGNTLFSGFNTRQTDVARSSTND